MSLFSIIHEQQDKLETIDPHNIPVVDDYISRDAFETGMNLCRYTLKAYKEVELQKIALDYVIELVKDDLQRDSCARLIYHKNGYQPFHLLPLFDVEDNNGNKVSSLVAEHQSITIHRANTHIISLLHQESSFVNGTRQLHTESFQFGSGNHKSVFVPFWNLHLIMQGGHHITSDFSRRKATVDTEIHDITRLFDHVYVNGDGWYNAQPNSLF